MMSVNPSMNMNKDPVVIVTVNDRIWIVAEHAEVLVR